MNLSQSNLTYERLQGRAGGTSSVGQVAPFRRYRLDKSKTPRVGPLFHVSGPAPAPNLDRTYNLARQRTRAKDTSMGLTYANLKLTNLFSQASIEVNAWVDCGATSEPRSCASPRMRPRNSASIRPRSRNNWSPWPMAISRRRRCACRVRSEERRVGKE